MDGCIFCKLANAQHVLENELAYAVYDVMPVNPGHLLIIPKRHAETWFDLTAEEEKAMLELLHKGKELLEAERHPDGFNFGVNCGGCAGQSVMHAHMHLIPRYAGDTEFPLGGVRGVIPEKMAEAAKALGK